VKLAKTGHGPHFSTLFVIRVLRLLFVLFCVLFVCKCVLPPGDNLIAVNKYIVSYRISPLERIALYLKGKGKGKSKAIPLQACTGPEGSRTLMLPDVQTFGT
jgi:hypothetical protein